MNRKVIVDGIGQMTLTDNDFLGSGGEGDVFVKQGTAYKIYHDSLKMMPMAKIDELKKIQSANVICPEHIIYDNKNMPIGYTMQFKKNTFPLCKLFTKSFKNRSNISSAQICDLINNMKNVIEKIHLASVLIVDLNELNVLADNKNLEPFFIDTDSYETKSYKCTAIMDSIRDRLIKSNKWSQMSDWYSFAILAFQLLVGIHPYKGGHPKYTPGDFAKRMQDGVSVFDKDATMPIVATPLNTLPPALLDWFKALFLDNKRLPPPDWKDVNGIMVPVAAIQFVQKVVSALFETEMKFKFNQQINHVFPFMGVNYFIGKDGIYKMNVKMPLSIKDTDKVLFCESGGVEPVVATLFTETASFYSGVKMIGSIKTSDIMYRNGCIYTMNSGTLIENSFTTMGDRTIHLTRQACGVLQNATQMYDGVIFQNLLGKMHITLPYEKGKIAIKSIPELNGFRIISATARANICVVVAEHKGKYNRFYITFDNSFTSYEIRIVDNVSCLTTNLAVLPSGVAVLALDNELELFKGANGKVIPSPPATSDNPLHIISGLLYYVDGDSLYTLKTK